MQDTTLVHERIHLSCIVADSFFCCNTVTGRAQPCAMITLRQKGREMKKVKLVTFVVMMLLVVTAGCKKSSTAPEEDPGPSMMNVFGEYMGATLPGSTPLRFAPDPLLTAGTTWFYHGSPIFSPDGTEMYFVKYFTATDQTEIWFTRREGTQWIVPQKASFSQGGFVNNPFFVGNDNDTLYFKSNMNGYFIHKVTRTANGWSAPTSLAIPLPVGYTAGNDFCVVSDGSVYFSADSLATKCEIFISRYNAGTYSTPESLTAINTSGYNEWLGFVDPSETYMIFVSNRTGGSGMHDLYLSRKSDTGWSTPVNLGVTINSSWEDGAPHITADGNYLFFNTVKSGDQGFTPYWVDSSILDALVK